MRRTRKATSTARTWRAQALSRGAFLEMLSACLALYFGQSSYNPGKVGGFGNLGKGQLSYNPGKVGGVHPREGNCRMMTWVVFGLGWATR